MVGNTNPTAAPRAWKATAIVTAITLSFGPNHTEASLAGAFNKKGYPMAQKTYPMITI